MAIRTPITEMFGIDYPVFLAPMAGGPTTPELVAAVSNAGGLGSFGASYTDGDGIRKLAGIARQLTNKAFGINLFVPERWEASEQTVEAAGAALDGYCAELDIAPLRYRGPDAPDFQVQVAAVCEERFPLVTFHFGLPEDAAIRAIRGTGAKIGASATTLAEGRALVRGGVDFVIAQGGEAGGHQGTFGRGADEGAGMTSGTFALVRRLAAALPVPVVAAGGVMDGRGLAAALALGAAGVQMGTAFLTCPEAGVHPGYRQALLELDDDRTVITRTFSGRRARGLRNRFVEEMTASGAPILPFPAQNTLTKGLRAAAATQNRTEFLSMWAGQAATLSRGLPAAELVARVVAEYSETLAGLPRPEG